MKVNCWDYMDCGLGPGGPRVKELGHCPAATYISFRGINDGMVAGRYCWHVAGNHQDGKPKCINVHKINDCKECSFYKLIEKEQGTKFQA